VNIALLNRIRAAGGQHVAMESLGIDPRQAAADLAELERFGFTFEHHPYLGVSYRAPSPALCPDQIEWELAPRRIGRRVVVWSRVTSTNDLAAHAAGSTGNEGLVVLAEEQTAGRGRLGRSWQAPRGSSLLVSVLLFPPPGLDRPWWLTALAAVAVAELAENRIGRRATIKWPNDVRVGGKKLAGVLVERRRGSVLGIGLNVNLDAADFDPELRDTATSLSREAGTRFDRSDLARELIARLDQLYDFAVSAGTESLDAAWSDRLEQRGLPVVIDTSAGKITGRLTEASLARGLTLQPESRASLLVPIADIRGLAVPEPAPERST
jgi:BirA family biotin operon repressor/biotin-[acetyl-CoA-carboxylase] ligase